MFICISNFQLVSFTVLQKIHCCIRLVYILSYISSICHYTVSNDDSIYQFQAVSYGVKIDHLFNMIRKEVIDKHEV
jgi:hypothetical protein